MPISAIFKKKITIHFFNDKQIEQSKQRIPKDKIDDNFKYKNCDYFCDSKFIWIDKQNKPHIDFILGERLPTSRANNKDAKHDGKKYSLLTSPKIIKKVFGGGGFALLEFFFGIGIGGGIAGFVVIALIVMGKIAIKV